MFGLVNLTTPTFIELLCAKPRGRQREMENEKSKVRPGLCPQQAWNPEVEMTRASPVALIKATHTNRHFWDVQGRRGHRSNTTTITNPQSGRGRGGWKTQEEERKALTRQLHPSAAGKGRHQAHWQTDSWQRGHGPA